MTTPILAARKALGVGLRRRDEAAHARVRAVLATSERRLSHRDVATLALTTPETVRAVRREMGDVCPAPTPTRITSRLLSGMTPRHVDALRRLGAAHARGSDMQTRTVLASAEIQQLLTAAREAGAA